MTNEEIICTFMEPAPPRVDELFGDEEPRPSYIPYRLPTWWQFAGWTVSKQWIPRALTLDALHEVEARLTEEQWWKYLGEIHDVTQGVRSYAYRHLIHTTAEQKLKAVAAVLRPVVEGEATH